MSQEKGREQVFQLGVNYINGYIDREFQGKFEGMEWNHDTKLKMLGIVLDGYRKMRSSAPFLHIVEYPRISIYMDVDKLKINVQGWGNTCRHCQLLGSMQYNKGTYYDIYYCNPNHLVGGEIDLKIRYGDNPEEVYLREVKYAQDCGLKWRAAVQLFNNRADILIINPYDLSSEIEYKKERK